MTSADSRDFETVNGVRFCRETVAAAAAARAAFNRVRAVDPGLARRLAAFTRALDMTAPERAAALAIGEGLDAALGDEADAFTFGDVLDAMAAADQFEAAARRR